MPLSLGEAHHKVEQDQELFWRENGSHHGAHHVLPDGKAEKGAVQGGQCRGHHGVIEPLGHLGL